MLHRAWLSYRWMLDCEVVHGTISMGHVVIISLLDWHPASYDRTNTGYTIWKKWTVQELYI